MKAKKNPTVKTTTRSIAELADKLGISENIYRSALELDPADGRYVFINRDNDGEEFEYYQDDVQSAAIGYVQNELGFHSYVVLDVSQPDGVERGRLRSRFRRAR